MYSIKISVTGLLSQLVSECVGGSQNETVSQQKE